MTTNKAQNITGAFIEDCHALGLIPDARDEVKAGDRVLVLWYPNDRYICGILERDVEEGGLGFACPEDTCGNLNSAHHVIKCN